MGEPIMADVRALLEQCEREDNSSPPERRFLYTDEIRRLLGFAFRVDYSDLERAISQDRNDDT
jgi:hypothetical protein